MKILAIGDFHGKFPAKLKKDLEKEKFDLILSTGDYAGIDAWRSPMKKSFKAYEKGKELSVADILGKKKYKQLLKKDYAEGRIPIIALNNFKVKTFSVFGNGDWYRIFFNEIGKHYENLIKKLKHVKNINRSKAYFRGLKIAGFGGYLDPDIYFTEKGRRAINDIPAVSQKRKQRYNQEARKLMKLMKIKPDFLLTHYTPYNCLDKMRAKGFKLTGSHMGVGFFNKAIKKFKPSLVVCGHMHENQGKCKIGRTTIVNPGAASEGKAAVIDFDEEKKRVKNIRFLR